MIYTLVHWYTDTDMAENGLPWWVDILGGLFDLTVITVVYFLI